MMSNSINKVLVSDQNVLEKIYHIRNQKVMLDIDLAVLYQVEIRALKQAVERNMLRFPDDFMFQLTKTEWHEVITVCDNLSQNAKFSPSTPFVFTEQGVAMLSSILNSERAIQVNIQIIRIFMNSLAKFMHSFNRFNCGNLVNSMIKDEGILITR